MLLRDIQVVVGVREECNQKFGHSRVVVIVVEPFLSFGTELSNATTSLLHCVLFCGKKERGTGTPTDRRISVGGGF